eukprot:5797487-Amphidinium_carterae.1
MSRSRFAGSTEHLQHVLASEIGRETIDYTENLEDKVDRKKLILYRELLRKLVRVQSNLCFTQQQMHDAFVLVGKNLGVPEAKLQGYAATCARKTRAMCHHSHQSYLKARGVKSSW